MQSVHADVVRGKDGWCGTVVPAAPHTPSDPEHVCVQLESGEQLLVPAAVLIPQQDGGYYVPLRLAELARTGGRPDTSNERVIPVLVEELAVQKRVAETGKVRITKTVHEREEVVDEPLVREEVEVERVPIQRVVDGPVPIRDEDGTTIIPILEEVLVVEKRLMLKEELHIRKRRVEIHQPQQVTLRCEEARVEREEAHIERLHNTEQENRAT